MFTFFFLLPLYQLRFVFIHYTLIHLQVLRLEGNHARLSLRHLYSHIPSIYQQWRSICTHTRRSGCALLVYSSDSLIFLGSALKALTLEGITPGLPSILLREYLAYSLFLSFILKVNTRKEITLRVRSLPLFPRHTLLSGVLLMCW